MLYAGWRSIGGGSKKRTYTGQHRWEPFSSSSRNSANGRSKPPLIYLTPLGTWNANTRELSQQCPSVGAINLQGGSPHGCRSENRGLGSTRVSMKPGVCGRVACPGSHRAPLAPPVTSAIWPVRSRAVLLLHSRGVEVLDQTKQTVRCHWQLEDLAAERRQCVGERICDRRRRADRAALPHAAEPA